MSKVIVIGCEASSIMAKIIEKRHIGEEVLFYADDKDVSEICDGKSMTQILRETEKNHSLQFPTRYSNIQPNLSWQDIQKPEDKQPTQFQKNYDYTLVPKSNVPVFDKHTIKFDKAGVYTVTVTPDCVTCEPVQKPKPEYPDIFNGTSRRGDIVDCDGVLLRREKASSDGICTGCYIHSKRVVECKYKTNCGESDIFKLYIPE